MYSCFNLEIDKSYFSDYFYDKGKLVLTENRLNLNSCLEEYIQEDGSINGEDLQTDWFGPINADIFISHSHKDEACAIALAGWLKEEMNLTAFVDSCVWGYANDLLDRINRKYNVERTDADGSMIYYHNDVLYSASHVHMMLCTALNKMLDKSESVFFLNTENSMIKSAGGDPKTDSPWIYLETNLANTIEKHIPDRIEKILHYDESKGLYEHAGAKFQYPVNLEKFVSLDHAGLAKWRVCYNKHGGHALDTLYLMCDLLEYDVF